jgi:hypothetical protein
MKPHFNTLLSTIMLLILALISCEEAPQPEAPPFPDLNLTARDSIEATVIAYYLAQTIEAPDTLLQSQLYHLNKLRQVYRDTFPFVDSIRFLPPWAVGSLSLGFDSTRIEMLIQGLYTDYSSIPERYRPDSIVVTSKNLGFARVYTNYQFHPVLLAEYYQQLPGLIWAVANRYGHYDYVNYPLLTFAQADTLEYIFHLSGDIYGFGEPPHFHHFVYAESQFAYNGEISFENYTQLAFDFMDWGSP